MGHKIDDLFRLVAELSGVPASCLKKELEGHLNRLNIDRLNITEADLRRVLSLYLEELNCSMLEEEYATNSDAQVLA